MVVGPRPAFVSCMLACQPKPAAHSGVKTRVNALMPAKAGGAEGGRTPDLLIANEALSQLSYGPAEVQQSGKCCTGWYVRVIYGATPRSVKGSARSLARGGQCGRF